tara:strand:+ start:146 stop:289 length:144 start_codon:yes stop_codon:yes gene_type:complete
MIVLRASHLFPPSPLITPLSEKIRTIKIIEKKIANLFFDEFILEGET